MALRDWTLARLARLWIVGVTVEALLLLGSAAYQRATEVPEMRAMRLHMDSLERASDAFDDSVAHGQRPPPHVMTAADMARFRALLRDSTGITWETRGRTTTVTLPPALGARVGQAFVAVSDGMATVLFLAAIIYLPIPIALLVVTGGWIEARRPWRRAARDAPAA